MTKDFNVSVSMNQAAPVKTGVVLKQGDFGFDLKITVLDFTVTGTTPQIVFRKPMGAVESTDVTASGNVYTYTFKGTELDTPGKVFCDLKLKNSTTQRISTASFQFEVVADTLDGLAEESNSYSDTIENIINGYESNFDELKRSISEQTDNILKIKNHTINGVTVYDNGDGTFTLNGTCTASAYMRFVGENSGELHLEAGRYSVFFDEGISGTRSAGALRFTADGTAKLNGSFFESNSGILCRMRLATAGESFNNYVCSFSIYNNVNVDYLYPYYTAKDYIARQDLINIDEKTNIFGDGQNILNPDQKYSGKKISLQYGFIDHESYDTFVIPVVPGKTYSIRHDKGNVFCYYSRSKIITSGSLFHDDSQFQYTEKNGGGFFTVPADAKYLCISFENDVNMHLWMYEGNTFKIFRKWVKPLKDEIIISAYDNILIDQELFFLTNRSDVNGINVYDNNDGTWTFDGTCTASAYLRIMGDPNGDIILPKGVYEVTFEKISGTTTGLPVVVYREVGASSWLNISESNIIALNNDIEFRIRIATTNDVLSSLKMNIGLRFLSNYTQLENKVEKQSILSGVSEFVTRYKEQERALYNKIKNDIDDNTLLFSVTTDNHYDPLKNRGIQQAETFSDFMQISERAGCEFAANLGDLIDSGEDDGTNDRQVNVDRIQKMMEPVKRSFLPFSYTIGHHEMYKYDSTDYSYTLEAKYVMGLANRFTKWLNIHKTANDSSYYFDMDKYKIRIISIDGMYRKWGFSTETQNNISNFLASVPLGYKVLFLSHIPLLSELLDTEIYNSAEMTAIIDSFISGGGQVLGWVSGHTHWDNMFIYNGFPIISIDMAGAINSPASPPAGVSGNPQVYPKLNGTYSVYCMEFLCVHVDSGKINLFRFGAGSDRTFIPE